MTLRYVSLIWTDKTLPQEFIEKAHELEKAGKEQEDQEITLTAHSSLMSALADMDETLFKNVLLAVKIMPLTCFELYLKSPTCPALTTKQKHRLLQLAMVLVTIPSLQTAALSSHFFGRRINTFPNLIQLTLSDYVERDYSFLATSLERHHSLQSLFLSLPTSSYRTLLPATLKLPILNALQLEHRAGLALPHPFDLIAIAQFAARNKPIVLTLRGFRLGGREIVHRRCREAIQMAKMKGVVFDECSMRIDESVALALVSSSLKIIKFNSRPFYCHEDFFKALAMGLSTMTCLEELHLLECMVEYDKKPLDDAVVMLIESVKNCASLRNFSIGLPSLNAKLVIAIAKELIGPHSTLKEIAIGLPLVKTTSLPAILEAVSTTFTVQDITFLPLIPNDFNMRETVEDMDNMFKCTTKINAVLLLNKAGRSYIQTAPENRARGCKVLAAVANSVSCLYVHLLENAGICSGTVPFVYRNRTNATNGGGGNIDVALPQRDQESGAN
ncbi:hypothetical protein MPSEU_000673700 [Mayamaea pseudoterrestris]|nr:hypothetical protein MPSEU_000673700 [Mayamaea pseudoterrestris]